MGRSPYQPDLVLPFQRIDHSLPVDGSPFELAIVHRDTRRTLCRFVGDEWSEADHPLEGESWILPPLGGLPCAMLAHVQKVRTLAHSAQSLSVHSDIAPCSAVHVSINQHDLHAASQTLRRLRLYRPDTTDCARCVTAQADSSGQVKGPLVPQRPPPVFAAL